MLDAATVVLDRVLGLGWLVPVAVLLPNVLWVVLPAAAPPPRAAPSRPPWTNWVAPVEWVGRAAVFILPALYRFEAGSNDIARWSMGAALAFYYLGWLRYFVGGRKAQLLYAPLLQVPVPLAVSPIVYFLAASVVLRAWPLAIAAAVFGAAHVALAWTEHRRLQEQLVGST